MNDVIQRLLIANRGEIALRILRTCKDLGIPTVCAYTRADRSLLHLNHADDTVCIGETSYLEPANMIAAALTHGCDAIHPGYGYLSENPSFARMVEEAGLRFVGPSADTLAIAADKARAREIAGRHGLNPLPGTMTPVPDGATAGREAEKIGFPLMLKAVHGGGGRGIRVIRDQAALKGMFAEAGTEALAAFGSGDLYLEKFLVPARHIEIQVFGNGAGQAITLGSRECSIQRNRQKLIEEAPAANLDALPLEDLCRRVEKMVMALEYRGAGTFEFLWQSGKFWFIELNARLQVEHPVTEAVTGLDLVKMQIEVASGMPLDTALASSGITGHAIEARINAEDERFMPAPGLVGSLVLPAGPGVRVDSHLYEGYVVPHHYDSLVAKIIVHGESRDVALARMKRALGEFRVSGIGTNVELLKRLVSHPDFARASTDTLFVERILEGSGPQ